MANAESGIDALFGQDICSVEGCEGKRFAKGWCAKHYHRWRAHGDLHINKRSPRGIHSCESCSREFQRRAGGTGRFCTPACVQAYAKINLVKDRTAECLTCGARFQAKRSDRSRWCDRRCADQWRTINALYRDAPRGKSAISRARRFGVAYEPIDPIKVFAAARWKCALCGVQTPKTLRGSIEPNAPELDHIIPMSLGGPHIRDNVQLACRKCNHAKGATLQGQLSLFLCVAA
jgi:5-methylcytosine-specific restriction endonuclease McrA